jgi:anti-anti-sigma factor
VAAIDLPADSSSPVVLPAAHEKIAPVEGAPEFSITRRPTGDAVVVAPVGEIDLATVETLEQALAAAREEADSVVLDLREVTFMDSAGLRMVLEASLAGGTFAVVRGPREVQRIFDLVGLDERRLTMLDQPPDG